MRAVALPPGDSLSEQLGQHIDMPIFLHFFYLKPGGEGRYAFYARKQTKLSTGAPTAIKAGRTDTSSSKKRDQTHSRFVQP
ncbi:hypothetical protein FNV43_RR21523 [Rhamnella rubrinervis]|uniref:Uncharacterized protein n=1 Tax=Rhamnella rubrinervis TaxID=2594499 RepID=A0A8K0GUG2_9ROSA|nr:hypothetical protein FNV43_RR21523 [Rhamnella rubrinervis]